MNDTDKIKVLFVRPYNSSFINRDFELLKNHFDARSLELRSNKKNLYEKIIILFNIIKNVLWADITFSWFADLHAFRVIRISKILRKKSIVVIGGYEVAKIPEIGYGSMLSQKSSQIVDYVLNNADKIIAVSEFSKSEILALAKSNNVVLVYNGVDCNRFKPEDENDNLVITVGNPSGNTCKLKGIDTFVKVSLAFPELKFIVIGTYDLEIRNHLNKIAPNVEFTGALSHEKVLSLMKSAKIYCQLSFRESFGMSLAEAMSCGCIPIVTDRGAMPEVVGNTGYYVPYGDIEATIEAIKVAFKSDNGNIARDRIKMMFPLEKRENKLKEIIETELWKSQ